MLPLLSVVATFAEVAVLRWENVSFPKETSENCWHDAPDFSEVCCYCFVLKIFLHHEGFMFAKLSHSLEMGVHVCDIIPKWSIMAPWGCF